LSTLCPIDGSGEPLFLLRANSGSFTRSIAPRSLSGIRFSERTINHLQPYPNSYVLILRSTNLIPYRLLEACSPPPLRTGEAPRRGTFELFETRCVPSSLPAALGSFRVRLKLMRSEIASKAGGFR
jgi:hypothetical protein